MRIKALFLIIAVFTAGSSHAATGQDAAGDRQDLEYRDLMLKNALLPGLGFAMLGNEKEARAYYASLPLSIAGTALAVSALLISTDGVVFDFQRQDGESYLFRYENELSPLSHVLLYGGVALGLYGNLLSAYSNYAVHRDYVDQYGDPFRPVPLRAGRSSFFRTVTAPYRADNVFNIEVLPVLGLSAMGGFSPVDIAAMGNYFKRDTVPIMGFQVHPVLGLGIHALSSGVLVTAIAAWEELAYRGLSLEMNGQVYSSISFGLAHLPNMLTPGISVEGTLLQTLFATAFGFYTSEQVKRRGYNLERMIALHYWHNMLALVLGYLVDPEQTQLFSIRYRLWM